MKSKVLSLFLAFFILTLSSLPVRGEPWKKSLDLGLTLTQNFYSGSWIGGEIENFCWSGSINGIFEKQYSPKFNLRNMAILQFGQAISENSQTESWQKPEKTTDLIDIESIGRFTAGRIFDPYASARIVTQFWDNSCGIKMRVFNPMQITESMGISKSIFSRDNNLILERFGLSLKEDFNRSIRDTSVGNTVYRVFFQTGLEFSSDIQLNFRGKYSYVSRLCIFKPLFHTKMDMYSTPEEAQYWSSTDVDFENNLSVAANQFLAASIYMQLLYDKQISLSGRFKEILGISLTFAVF